MLPSSSPLRRALPDRAAAQPAGTPAQQAFRQAIRAVEELRAQLSGLRAAQAAARQTYWCQVGPVAAAVVAARRALYEPLEMALTSGYLNRAEEQQVTRLLLHNAGSLQARFGEDETAIITRYAAPPTPPAGLAEAPPAAPATASAEPPPHERAAAAARARRQQRAQQARETKSRAADTAGQALLQNTKAAYRQLARLHHPDRAAQDDAAAQQIQTEVMQRITAAYAAGDLAALLALLAEEATPTPPTAEAEALLLRYAQALAQQQAQLGQELAAAQRPTENEPWSGTEKQQRAQLRQLKRDLRAETDYLILLVRQLHEPAGLRQLLRELATSRQAGI